MPGIAVDVASVPDIIEAQLTLSYSRLTDLIRVIVDQGNGNADDIDELRDRIGKVVQENGALRAEIDALKQNQGAGGDLAAILNDLKGNVAQLNEKVELNSQGLTALQATQETAKAEAASADSERNAAAAGQINTLMERLNGIEAAANFGQAFADLWGGSREDVLEMGHRTDYGELAHSAADRISYVRSLPPLEKLEEEMKVIQALVQRQGADALAAKTSEAARTSRTASVAAAANHGQEELQQLAAAVQRVEAQLAGLAEHVQTLPGSGSDAASGLGSRPLSAPFQDTQDRSEMEARLNNAEQDVTRLYDQLGLVEDRLNTMLGLAEANKTGVASASRELDSAHPGLVDVARRVSTLEGVVDGVARGSKDSAQRPISHGGSTVDDVGNSDGEVTNVEAGFGRRSTTREVTARPSSTPPSTGQLPHLAKDGGAPNGNYIDSANPNAPARGEANHSKSTIPRSQTPGGEMFIDNGAVSAFSGTSGQPSDTPGRNGQPTVDALRRRSEMGAGGRRISVQVTPEDGLRRRVTQLEENVAILEVHKADRIELQQMGEVLRQLTGSSGRVQPGGLGLASTLVPQRPSSMGPRFYAQPYPPAAGMMMGMGAGQMGDSTGRASPVLGRIGRPMFVGSASAVFLRDGNRCTNATVSSPPGQRTV